MSFGDRDLWTYGPASIWFAHTETATVMQHDEPNFPIEAKPNAGGHIAFDWPRLRATLRLCFVPEKADALAARARWDETDPVRALTKVVRLARVNFSSRRWLPSFGTAQKSSDRAMPLRPRLNLSSVPALTLALHLGLDLKMDTLAALFGRSSSTIATALLHARQAIEPTLPLPCAGFVEPAGRYRDPVTDRIDERLAFMQHLTTCGRCKLALSEARQIDNRLLATIAENERELLPMAEQHHAQRTLWFEPTLLSGSVALLTVMLLLAGIVGWRRLTAEHAPVPLLATSAPTPTLSGWLLQTSSVGDVSAVNVATGEQRLLVPAINNSDVQTMLAPDQRHLAQLIATIGDNASVTLRSYTLDGTLMHEWADLDRTDRDQLLGWLDDNTILVSRAPNGAPGELDQSTLLAFDIDTGTQRTILDGSINSAVASSDGRYLAIGDYLPDGTGALQIRPVTEARLGDPIVNFTHGGTPLVWTKDGRLIFWSVTASSSALDTISLDGTVTQIAQSVAYYPPNTLGFSSDRTEVIYVTNTGFAGSHPWTYWEEDLSGGQPRALAEDNAGYALPGDVVWSPDDQVVALTLAEPFYLPNLAQTGSATSIASFRTVAFGADGQTRGSLLDQFTDQSLLAWLPDGALPMQAEATAQNSTNVHISDFRTVGLPALGGLRPELSNTSSLSPDRSNALIYDPTYDFAMAVPLNGDASEQIGGVPLDASWLPDSSGGIGVQHHSVSDGTISRITLHAPDTTPVDFDPVQLGDSTAASYRYPMLAPNGLHYSFFVVDGQHIALWVGGDNDPPRVVTSWLTPAGAKVAPPLIADWVDNDTLIYSEPESWRGGLPQRVTLHRLVLNADATTDNTLISWEPRGNERGIVLQELRVSADRGALAVRLRHVTGSDPSKDAFDSIDAASTSDLHQSFELARGTPGNGLSWSPDGTQLVSVIQGKLTIFTIHGGRSETVDTGSRPVNYPLWVLPNEIWYQSGTDNGGQMLRATR